MTVGRQRFHHGHHQHDVDPSQGNQMHGQLDVSMGIPVRLR
jgi:hypothetical protein